MLCLLLVILQSILKTNPVSAMGYQESDPVAQCAQGVKLFNVGRITEALPLLEAGFMQRNQGTFAQSDDLGFCALALGLIYDRIGKYPEALEADKVALNIFTETGNRRGEGYTFNGLGILYTNQRRYSDALVQYQQALLIYRELGEQAGEATLLITIGQLYATQRQYPKALETYQQALLIEQKISDRDGEGTALHKIGMVYNHQGRYGDALELFQQALVIEREVGDRAGEAYTLYGMGEVYDSQGRYAEALEMNQQALAIRRELGDRAGEANTLNNLGVIYTRKGMFTQALEIFQQALDLRRELGDRAGEATTLNNLAGVYSYQGQYAKALGLYQQALGMQREVDDRDGEGTTLHSMGRVYQNQGQYTKALEMYQQALIMRREVGDLAGEGTTLNGIGAVYSSLGQYPKALEFHRQALAIQKEIGDLATQGSTLSNIGFVYAHQGRYADALDQYQQALAVQQEIGDQYSEGSTLYFIAQIYADQGREAAALEQYQKALIILQKVGNRASEGVAFNNIGTIYAKQGRDTEALEQFQKALNILREVGDRDTEGTTLNNIGVIYSHQKHYTEALEQYQQALVIQRETGTRAGEGTLLNNIGRVYDQQGRYTEALEQYQQALTIAREVGERFTETEVLGNIGFVSHELGQETEALAYYEQAMTLFETLRSTAGGEAARAGVSAQQASLYDLAVELYYQQNQIQKAFFSAERGRARTFLDSLSTNYVDLNDNASTALYIAEQAAYSARQSAQDALAKAKAQTSPDAKLIANMETQLAQAEKDYQAALDSISKRSNYLEQLIPGRSHILDVPQAQNLLDDQTTLLSFWVLDNQTLVFVLTKNTFTTVALPVTRLDLYAKIKAFRDFSNTDVAHPESAVELYQVLIEPLKTYIATSNLVIVPNGELHYLPLGALTDGKRYLLDDYSMTYLPSVSAWPYIKQNAGETNANLLIVGNPATNQTGLSPLLFAESEVQAIASLYQAKPLLGKAATESAVRNQAGQAGVLHLAAHGNYNTLNPLYSAIYLAPDNQNDGLLETHEIYGLNLKQTNLVVLSACETQLGELSTGDELVGLTRAFLFAGTPSVISSLWSVDDKATQLLMEKFYTYWKGGMGKAEALRRAQIDMREEYPNPYYWAGFVLSGDGEKSTGIGFFQSPTPTNILIIVGLSCCLFLVLLIGFTLGIIRMRKKTPLSFAGIS